MNNGLLPLPQRHRYESEEQPFASVSNIVFNLPIARMPDIVQPVVICRVAEFGYLIGDEVDNPPAADYNSGAGANYTLVRRPGQVTLYVYTAGGRLVRRDAGGTFPMTVGRWNCKVYCLWFSP